MTQKTPAMRYPTYPELMADLSRALKIACGSGVEDLTEVPLNDLVPEVIPFPDGMAALLHLVCHRPRGAVSLQTEQNEARFRVHGLKIFFDLPGCSRQDALRMWKDVLQQAEAHITFHEYEAEAPSGEFLLVQDIILAASRSWIDASLVHDFLRDCRMIRRTGRFDEVLADFQLTPQESFIAYRIEGDNTTIESLRILTGLPEELILRTLYFLALIDAVKL